MSESYIRQLYELALNDYRIASSDEARQKALAELARLTAVATDVYGFEFADSLREGVSL